MTTSRIVIGCAALAAYLILFSAGMMLDSKPYREELATWTLNLDFRTVDTEAALGSVAVAQTAEHEASAAPVADKPSPQPVGRTSVPVTTFAATFVSAMCLYTPINIALLALIAALLGGCASNLTYHQQAGTLTEQQAAFRSENPAASMIRGFLVYLAFVAGIYMATNAPFADVTGDQYARLAGTISFLAFVVGYDPTKFQDFITKSPIPVKP